MLKLLALILVGSTFYFAGCSTTEHPDQKVEAPKSFIKCATCGAEFTSRAGWIEHLREHPDHKAVQPVVIMKCTTCGVEFTSLDEAEAHIKAHPGHKTAPIEGQFIK